MEASNEIKVTALTDLDQGFEPDRDPWGETGWGPVVAVAHPHPGQEPEVLLCRHADGVITVRVGDGRYVALNGHEVEKVAGPLLACIVGDDGNMHLLDREPRRVVIGEPAVSRCGKWCGKVDMRLYKARWSDICQQCREGMSEQ